MGMKIFPATFGGHEDRPPLFPFFDRPPSSGPSLRNHVHIKQEITNSELGCQKFGVFGSGDQNIVRSGFPFSALISPRCPLEMI